MRLDGSSQIHLTVANHLSNPEIERLTGAKHYRDTGKSQHPATGYRNQSKTKDLETRSYVAKSIGNVAFLP